MEEPIFNIIRGNHKYPVADFKHLFYLAGSPGSGKTTHLSYIEASALKEEPVLGYELNLKDRCILHIDGEQSPDFYQRGYNNIKTLCGGKNMDRLIYPEDSLASITKVRDREQEMWKIITKYRKDIGVLVIDRLGNFVSDPNNTPEAERLISRLVSVTEWYNCLTIGVHHVTVDSRTGKSLKLFAMLGTLYNQLSPGGMQTFKNSKYYGIAGHKDRYGSYPDLWTQFDEETGFMTAEPYLPYPLK